MAVSSILRKAIAASGAGVALQSEDADAGVVTRGGKRLIEAFHGSPHKFDRFSMDAIGTGEGAQAYGHGLYFADSEAVAKEYRDSLSPSSLPDGDAYGARTILVRKGEEEGSRLFRDAYRKGGLPDDEIEAALQAARDDLANPQGALYKVELDVDPDTLLDWDKPLSEQSEAVQRALQPVVDEQTRIMQSRANIYTKPVDEILASRTGGDWLDYLPDANIEGVRATREGASEYLRSQGIPGIRYADGMSRGNSLSAQAQALVDGQGSKDAALDLAKRRLEGIGFGDSAGRAHWEKMVDDLSQESTYNYVMFDDKPVSITERGNASPEMLAATGGGSAAAMGLLDPVFDALELPWKGYLGATRVAGGLLAGEGFDEALDRGVRQVRQPVEETADELGGAATDATGRPEIGTLAYLMTLLGGPI